MPIDPIRAEAIFNAALAVAPAARPAFLAAECGADAELRARVERLLAAHAELGDPPTADAPADPPTATFGDVGPLRITPRARMSAPWSNMWVAHEWRSTCGLNRPARPARSP